MLTLLLPKTILIIIALMSMPFMTGAVDEEISECRVLRVESSGIEFEEFSGICYDAKNNCYFAVADGPKGDARNQIFRIEIKGERAVVTDAFPIRENGAIIDAELDLEGIAIDANGDFYLCEERRLQLIKIDPKGNIIERVQIPEDIVDKDDVVLNAGIEGVTLSPDGETLYMIFQKPLRSEEKGRVCLLTYHLTTKKFEKYFVELGDACAERENLSASDIFAVGQDELLIIERDNLSGKKAGYKRVFTVSIKNGTVKKKALYNLLYQCNYSYKKPEGICVNSAGEYVIVNDANSRDTYLMFLKE